jgi:hypothetical protein
MSAAPLQQIGCSGGEDESAYPADGGIVSRIGYG